MVSMEFFSPVFSPVSSLVSSLVSSPVSSLVFSLVAGLVSLLLVLLYQRSPLPFVFSDLIHYLKLRSYRKSLQARMKRGTVTFLDCFLVQAKQNPNKPFIIFEKQTLTYRDVDYRSNQFARVFRVHASLKKGDIVALLMRNEPDFIAAWFGLCKLGCEVAFINVHIKSRSLLHCVRTCGAKTVVTGSDLVSLVEDMLSEEKTDDVDVWVMDHVSPSGTFNSVLDKMENVSGQGLSQLPKVDVTSNFLFIFTSGTTGLCKAARLGHLKAIMSMAFMEMCGASSDDIIYIALPLYHMSASLLGIGGCIQLGATCVLKKKFSASHFWKDCVENNVTVVQYIGELCRYLVNHPVVPEERTHRVRLAAGSGLRLDVWRRFSQRFSRIRIREGYGLTEASIGFLNYTEEIGPIGRAGYFNKLSMPFEILRYDPQSNEPIRADSGRCVRADKGEAGILVAPLTAINQFLGYAGNKVQSEKKLLRDVFKAGDVYFNTGDLLLQDHRDFLYFHDRIGDTFRWKGENVSTTEVSEVLGLLDFIKESSVYGVTVPGREGRAGMAAIVLHDHHKLDGPQLFNHLVRELPAYAWPRFLRVQTSLDVTETFKQKKMQLVQEGFKVDVVQEPLFYLDLAQKDYVLMTVSVYQDIVSGIFPL